MHFCIIGTGRCGTTLLRNLFNIHPQLYVYNETHWIPKMFEFFGTGKADVNALIEIIRRTYHITGKPVVDLEKLNLNIDLLGRERMTIAEFCNILGYSIAHRQGKTLWADKTPDYGPYLQMLQLLWPKCRFVHIIRHGAPVAISMSRHPGFRWMAAAGEMWWPPASFNSYYRVIKVKNRKLLNLFRHKVLRRTNGPIEEFIELWYRRLLRIREEATRLNPGSYLEVRFEDLVDQPRVTLKKIAVFIGVSVPEDWLTEAEGLIDIKRIHNHDRKISLKEFEPRHRDLLTSLGYE